MKRSREDRDIFDEVLGSDSEHEALTEPKASTSAAAVEEEPSDIEETADAEPKSEKVLDLAKLAKFNKKIDNTGFVDE